MAFFCSSNSFPERMPPCFNPASLSRSSGSLMVLFLSQRKNGRTDAFEKHTQYPISSRFF